MTTGPTTVSQYYVTSGSTTDEVQEEIFNRISGFFNSNPGYSQIAQSGSVGTQESYKVWRAVSCSQPFDVVLKWSYSSFWSFWETNGDYGLGVSIGMHPTGEAWAGTTTNVQDAPPFSPFKSGSFIFDRSTSVGGTYFTARNYFQQLQQTPPSNLGIAISGDYDSFTIAFNVDNNSTFNNLFYFGKFIPNNPSYNCPFVYFYNSSGTPLPQNQVFGSLNGTVGYDGCLIYHTASTSVTNSLPIGERFTVDYPLHYAYPMPISSSFFQKVLEYPITILAKETGGANVGYINDIRVTHNQIANLSRLSDGNRLVISSSDPNLTYNFTIPWNSGTIIPSGSFFSGSQTQFMTGSSVFGHGGQAGNFVDRLGTTDAITTILAQTIIQESILYRGVIGGNYVYSVDERPTGATDVVTIIKT